MSLKGYDYFTSIPDGADQMECRVCGAVCDVTRGVVGPTSFAGAMAGCKTKHDSFKCPNADLPWHKQALDIFVLIEKNPSPSLKKIMQGDLKTIIKRKKEME